MDGHVSRQGDAASSSSISSSSRDRRRVDVVDGRFDGPSSTSVAARPRSTPSGHLLANFRSAGATSFRRPSTAPAERLTEGSSKPRPGQAVEEEVGDSFKDQFSAPAESSARSMRLGYDLFCVERDLKTRLTR